MKRYLLISGSTMVVVLVAFLITSSQVMRSLFRLGLDYSPRLSVPAFHPPKSVLGETTTLSKQTVTTSKPATTTPSAAPVASPTATEPTIGMLTGLTYAKTNARCNSPGVTCGNTPIAAAVQIMKNGTFVATVTSDAKTGQFSIELPPGAYTLLPQPFGKLQPKTSSVNVTITSNAVASVSLYWQ